MKIYGNLFLRNSVLSRALYIHYFAVFEVKKLEIQKKLQEVRNLRKYCGRLLALDRATR